MGITALGKRIHAIPKNGLWCIDEIPAAELFLSAKEFLSYPALKKKN